MTSHLAKILLSHITASVVIEWSPNTLLEQSCDFHIPAGTSLAARVSEGSGKAQQSGSAPAVSRQPCEAVSTGCPAEGLRGAEPKVASAPWKGHLFLIHTKTQYGLAAARLDSQQPSDSSFPGFYQLIYLIYEVVALCGSENQ